MRMCACMAAGAWGHGGLPGPAAGHRRGTPAWPPGEPLRGTRGGGTRPGAGQHGREPALQRCVTARQAFGSGCHAARPASPPPHAPSPSVPLHALPWPWALQAGPTFAASDRFQVTITGQGGHAGMPHKTRDAVVAASVRRLPGLECTLPAWPVRQADGSAPGGESVHVGKPGRLTAGGCARSCKDLRWCRQLTCLHASATTVAPAVVTRWACTADGSCGAAAAAVTRD